MTAPLRSRPDEMEAAASESRSGVLARQDIRALVREGCIRADGGIEEGQFQPASLDLRLGPVAHRVRASFLPGLNKTVQQQLDALSSGTLSLEGDGAVLERGCVYVVELQESLQDLSPLISALANPKSSTGRLDVFTRLITDRSELFDSVTPGYTGKLYAEISPSSFSIRVRKGSRLNQLRFRRAGGGEDHQDFKLPDRRLADIHAQTPLVDGPAKIRNGLVLHIELGAFGPDGIIGYRAQRYTDVIDVDRVGACPALDYWEPLRARPDKRLILDPNQFYILASKEKLRIPANLAAEMVPIDPMMGEFRVHYAGFFDPGFGSSASGQPASRGVLEVRSHEVPFVLEDGQVIGRLAYEEMTQEPDALYGAVGTSNYQGQGLKLSKHFRMD